MWDWLHLRGEGWLAHTTRSVKLAGLLLASGVTMLLHILVPFWQQPKPLQVCAVARTICEEMDRQRKRNIMM